jgi:hypothetical protein
VTIAAGDASVTVPGGAGPGAADLVGLPPDTRLTLTVSAPGQPPGAVTRFRTLPPPPGEMLFRFATVNDMHIGSRKFGTLKPFREPPGTEPPHPVRCGRAALTEAVAWGAELIVGKGDVTDNGRPEQWHTVAQLFAETGLPVMVTNGNHDVHRGAVPGAPILAPHGIEMSDGVAHRDVPGARLIVVDTAIPTERHGRLAHAADPVVELIHEAGGPVVVAMHHYPQVGRRVNTWPPGVPAPEAPEFLEAVARARPGVLLTSGHTHRHRRHRHGTLVHTEVGSTKDYPGTWAGYAVHEGGIRQVVRRVAAPDAISWTDRTRMVLGGVWGMWAAGRLGERCFVHPWP